MSREPTLSLPEAEEQLQRTIREHSQQDQHRLLAQTDDAKVLVTCRAALSVAGGDLTSRANT